MIHELQVNDYKKIKPLLIGLEHHPVINGVVDGNNRGKIYVDNPDTPTAACIWAINEMFYLIGDSNNQKFNIVLEDFIINKITREAMQIGEEDFNLELYPFEEWNKNLKNIFSTPLNVGERVPFKGFRELIQVKIAELSDLDEIFMIDEAVIGNESRREYLKQAVATKKCLVARARSSVVGFLIYNTHFFDCSFISLVIVHPLERRKGHAKALMANFEGMAPTRKIFSSTNQSNEKMQKVFESLGYVKSGFVDNLDEGDPEIVYFKTINETKSSKSRNT